LLDSLLQEILRSSFNKVSRMSRLALPLIEWLKTRSDLTHNCLTVAGVSASLPLLSSLAPASIAALNLTSISVQLGTQSYVGLVSGPTMFLNMPRPAFGDLQARLFPKMGMVCVGTGILSLATYAMSHQVDAATYYLAASLGLNLANAFLVFPVTTHYMFELRKFKEGSKERKEVGMKFGILHLISVLINCGSMGLNFAYICSIAGILANHW